MSKSVKNCPSNMVGILLNLILMILGAAVEIRYAMRTWVSALLGRPFGEHIEYPPKHPNHSLIV
jgi:hypothetical protein